MHLRSVQAGGGVAQVKLTGIKISGVSLKDGKLIKKPTYASVSDKLKRGTKRKIVKGKRI